MCIAKAFNSLIVIAEQYLSCSVRRVRRKADRTEMAWCAARALHMPALDITALRSKTPLAVGVGCASVAGTTLCRSSSTSKRQIPFASLSISTDASTPSFFCLFPIDSSFFVDQFSLWISDCGFVLSLTLVLSKPQWIL